MVNLKNQRVRHKVWGLGTVTEQTETDFKVSFPTMTKRFSYPNALETFLTCEDKKLQNKVLAELKQKKETAVQAISRCIETYQNNNDDTNSHRRKKKVVKENVAFKCNFCDGGKRKNGIGFRSVCSDKMIWYNIEEAQHTWCCDPASPCCQYHDGLISRSELDQCDIGESCYESQMLENWAAFAGTILSGVNKGKPKRLEKVQLNSLAILTTRAPYAPEEERFIFAVFLVDDAYEGDNREAGYVTTSSRFKLSLPLKEAKKMLFWNYYHNENAPEKAVWSQGLHRYISNNQAACILKDLMKLKKHTKDEKLAKEFFEYFCQINALDCSELAEPDGALCRE